MQPQGLSSEEVKKRKVSGRSNDTDDQSSRSYLDILIKNLATPFNLILFILGALLIVMPEKPDYINAMAATGVILFNVLISTIQEMKAKRRLDKIALLMRPKVKVMRDGRIVEIDRSDIVMDDAIYLSPGDQAQVDGIIVDERMLEMDESLLTGESSTRRKHEGDTVYSGSYCISGECWFIVNKVGEDTFSSKMLRSAKKFEKKKTPLQVETNAVTEMLMILAFIFLALLVVLNIFRNIDVVDSLRQAVIVLDIVPIALFLLITLTYMIAAVRMADSGVLLQNSSSVESMSHVDTVCMDKTGTITTNNLVFNDIDYISADRGEVDRLVKEFVSTTGSRNRTIIAIEDKYGKGDYELDDEVQFSSDRKFSAVRVKNGDSYDTIIMGAFPQRPCKRTGRHRREALGTVFQRTALGRLPVRRLRTPAQWRGYRPPRPDGTCRHLHNRRGQTRLQGDPPTVLGERDRHQGHIRRRSGDGRCHIQDRGHPRREEDNLRRGTLGHVPRGI